MIGLFMKSSLRSTGNPDMLAVWQVLPGVTLSEARSPTLDACSLGLRKDPPLASRLMPKLSSFNQMSEI